MVFTVSLNIIINPHNRKKNEIYIYIYFIIYFFFFTHTNYRQILE